MVKGTRVNTTIANSFNKYPSIINMISASYRLLHWGYT